MRRAACHATAVGFQQSADLREEADAYLVRRVKAICADEPSISTAAIARQLAVSEGKAATLRRKAGTPRKTT